MAEQIAGADRRNGGHGSGVACSLQLVNDNSTAGRITRNSIARRGPPAIIRQGFFGDMMLQLQSAFGVVALLAIAWALGENRHAVSLRQTLIGLVVTLVTAVVLIKLPIVARAFGVINHAVGAIASS